MGNPNESGTYSTSDHDLPRPGASANGSDIWRKLNNGGDDYVDPTRSGPNNSLIALGTSTRRKMGRRGRGRR